MNFTITRTNGLFPSGGYSYTGTGSSSVPPNSPNQTQTQTQATSSNGSRTPLSPEEYLNSFKGGVNNISPFARLQQYNDDGTPEPTGEKPPEEKLTSDIPSKEVKEAKNTLDKENSTTGEESWNRAEGKVTKKERKIGDDPQTNTSKQPNAEAEKVGV